MFIRQQKIQKFSCVDAIIAGTVRYSVVVYEPSTTVGVWIVEGKWSWKQYKNANLRIAKLSRCVWQHKRVNTTLLVSQISHYKVIVLAFLWVLFLFLLLNYRLLFIRAIVDKYESPRNAMSLNNAQPCRGDEGIVLSKCGAINAVRKQAVGATQ